MGGWVGGLSDVCLCSQEHGWVGGWVGGLSDVCLCPQEMKPYAQRPKLNHLCHPQITVLDTA